MKRFIWLVLLVLVIAAVLFLLGLLIIAAGRGVIV